MALVGSDPFRELDRLAQKVWGLSNGTRSLAMPMDAYRKGASFLIPFDLLGLIHPMRRRQTKPGSTE